MVQVPCKFKAVYLILLHSLCSHRTLCDTQHHIFSSFKKKKSQGISHHFLRIPFLLCLWLKKEKKKQTRKDTGYV